ncbi:PucR family transcriptional regulator [Mycolicibacterium iranicum]|uniref:Helix-turn-helix domain-containing protein n=1 Tax=Mycolicibacterium iranicum TaxID=912594 RepID=A0ABT4HJD7_MYCIR|nr:helix-turn-helix domain-containing protein [Mycolicibacterium iranicum]MCZ0730300.1 helix-turn-helix domain-containing protein [Mycolicibacterium iranicum]
MVSADPPPRIKPWFAALEPQALQPFPDTSALPERAQQLAEALGPGPAGWAVELGALMASRVTAAIPELAVDVVADEVARGCEAVALGALSLVALDDDVAFAKMPEILAGPMEVVARGIGIEHMLRSIHLAHSTAVAFLLDAAERLVPEAERFSEMRRINEVLFGIVDVLTTRMAEEYTRAHEEWLASSVALRMQIVEDVLAGNPVPTDRAVRVLGYDLNRWHLGIIVWTGPAEPAEPAQLRAVAAETLAAAGCASTLVLPVGAQRVWAWGSRTTTPPDAVTPLASPPPGIRLAIGTAGAGTDGFRQTHQRAAEVARLGSMSTRQARVYRYEDLDIVAMLSTDLAAAREFVARELGDLAGSAEAVRTVRETLKCYLDRDRSLAGTAAHLQVARNTVAYRVQRAEQLRGRPATVRRLQLHAALALVDELGDVALGPVSHSLD